MNLKKILIPSFSILSLGVIGGASYGSYYLGTKNTKEVKITSQTNQKNVDNNVVSNKNNIVNNKDALIEKLKGIQGKFLFSNYNIRFAPQVSHGSQGTGKNFFKLLKNFIFDAIVSNNIDINFKDFNLIDNVDNLEWKLIKNVKNESLVKMYKGKENEPLKKKQFEKDNQMYSNSSGDIKVLKVKLKIKNSENIMQDIILNILWFYDDVQDSENAFKSKKIFIKSIFDFASKEFDKSNKNQDEWIYNLEIPKEYYIGNYYLEVISSISSYLKNKNNYIYSFNDYLSSNLWGTFNKNKPITNFDFGKSFNISNKFDIEYLFPIDALPSASNSKKNYKLTIKISLKFV